MPTCRTFRNWVVGTALGAAGTVGLAAQDAPPQRAEPQVVLIDHPAEARGDELGAAVGSGIEGGTFVGNTIVDGKIVDGIAIPAGAAVEIGPPGRSPTGQAAVVEAHPATEVVAGRLVIYRTPAKSGVRTPKVSVNGVALFRPKPRTYTDIPLLPGVHRVTLDWAADTGRPDLTFDIRIAPGHTEYVRISASHTFVAASTYQLGTFAEWVAPETAAPEVIDCCRRLRNTLESR